MAEERQQQRSAQATGQNHQPHDQQSAGSSSQESQRRGGGQQTGLAQRRGGLSSLWNTDPFDMLRGAPFALMRRWREEMDHWFEQFGIGRGGHGMTAGSGLFAPPVEMFEREGHFVVRADLPGMTKDDIRVEVTDDALLLEGERRSEHEERQEGTFHSERRYGMFRRQIPLPEGVNAEQVAATFKDGVLEVTMPASHQQTRGRRIDIQGTPSSTASQVTSGSEQPVGHNTGHEQAPTSGQTS